MTDHEQDFIDMIAKAIPDNPVNTDHRDRLRQQALDTYDQRDVSNEPTRNPLFKITGISVMKFAAAISLIAAVGIFAFIALAPSKAIAFEDVAHNILNVKTVSYDMTGLLDNIERGKAEDTGTYKTTTLLPNLTRSELPGKLTTVIDSAKDKIMILHHEPKIALIFEGMLEAGGNKENANFFGIIQDHLRRAEQGNNFENVKYETLEKKRVDGVDAVGFRVHNPENIEDTDNVEGLFFSTIDIWANAKTGLPIRIETTKRLADKTKQIHTMKNFVYDKDVDPKLFAFEVPEGYELMDTNALLSVDQISGDEGELAEDLNKLADKLADDLGKNVESILEDLGNERPSNDHVIDALHAYSRQTSGKLPDTLESGPMVDAMMAAWEKDNPGKKLFNDDASFIDEKLNQNMALIVQASAYLQFLEQSGGQYTYRGKGVKTDAEPTPVLWLQSKGAPAYTVIYNDFSVRDTNQGPNDR